MESKIRACDYSMENSSRTSQGDQHIYAMAELTQCASLTMKVCVTPTLGRLTSLTLSTRAEPLSSHTCFFFLCPRFFVSVSLLSGEIRRKEGCVRGERAVLRRAREGRQRKMESQGLLSLGRKRGENHLCAQSRKLILSPTETAAQPAACLWVVPSLRFCLPLQR